MPAKKRVPPPNTLRGAAWSVWRFVRLGLAAYLVVLLLMLIFENRLLYFPPPLERTDWRQSFDEFEEARFASADGTKLHGFYLDHPNPAAHVLYCHGNAEDAADLTMLARTYRDELGCAILVWDYRGYGKSEGSPHEAGILQDGRAARDWLAERAGIRPADVVHVGRSLGGGVSVDLAAGDGARGLVLESTFTSMPEVAAIHYPWAPVRLMMKTRYDSLTKIKRYEGPLLLSHGEGDAVVPPAIGRKLYDACPSGNKELVFLEGGHNDRPPPKYHQALADFLKRLPPIEPAEKKE